MNSYRCTEKMIRKNTNIIPICEVFLIKSRLKKDTFFQLKSLNDVVGCDRYENPMNFFKYSGRKFND